MCDSVMSDCTLHPQKIPDHPLSEAAKHQCTGRSACMCVCTCERVCVCVHVWACVLYKGRHGCHPPAPSCADTQVLIFAHLSPHQLLRPFPEGSPGRPQKSKQRQELIFIHRRDGNNKENLQFCQCYSRINRKHSRYLCDLLIRFKLDTISLKLASGL